MVLWGKKEEGSCSSGIRSCEDDRLVWVKIWTWVSMKKLFVGLFYLDRGGLTSLLKSTTCKDKFRGSPVYSYVDAMRWWRLIAVRLDVEVVVLLACFFFRLYATCLCYGDELAVLVLINPKSSDLSFF